MCSINQGGYNVETLLFLNHWVYYLKSYLLQMDKSSIQSNQNALCKYGLLDAVDVEHQHSDHTKLWVYEFDLRCRHGTGPPGGIQ